MWVLRDLLAAVLLLWGVSFYLQGRSGAFHWSMQVVLDGIAIALCIAAFNIQAV